MHVLGVDFTSRPRQRKAITCVHAKFSEQTLHADRIERLEDFAAFAQLLARPGAWVGGFDLPFSLPRALVAQLGWPLEWRSLVVQVARLSRAEFRDLLDEVRRARPSGSKYLHRATDLPAGSSSPMKLVNPPVALMFYEGAPRLSASGVTVFPCAEGDPARIALEAYPGMLARRITRRSYKAEAIAEQTRARSSARGEILRALLARARELLGFEVKLHHAIERAARLDGSGDVLDALLCACQAAWGYARRSRRYGLPARVDALEGWIVGALPGEDRR
ncbi:MAG: DUF429 domain-containing protein [Burkholderiales bacterium]